MYVRGGRDLGSMGNNMAITGAVYVGDLQVLMLMDGGIGAPYLRCGECDSIP